METNQTNHIETDLAKTKRLGVPEQDANSEQEFASSEYLKECQFSGMTLLNTMTRKSWGKTLYEQLELDYEKASQVINVKGGLKGIMELQKLLNMNGFSLPVDGIKEKETNRAVFAYINRKQSEQLKRQENQERKQEIGQLQNLEYELHRTYSISQGKDYSQREVEKSHDVSPSKKEKVVENRTNSEQIKAYALIDPVVQKFIPLYDIDTEQFRGVEYSNIQQLAYRYQTVEGIESRYPDLINFIFQFYRERLRLHSDNPIVQAHAKLSATTSWGSNCWLSGLQDLEQLLDSDGGLKISSLDLLEFQRLSFSLSQTIC